MGRWLSVSFHLIWPLQGQIGHTVSRRSAAAPLRGGGRLLARPLRGPIRGAREVLLPGLAKRYLSRVHTMQIRI